ARRRPRGILFPPHLLMRLVPDRGCCRSASDPERGRQRLCERIFFPCRMSISGHRKRPGMVCGVDAIPATGAAELPAPAASERQENGMIRVSKLISRPAGETLRLAVSEVSGVTLTVSDVDRAVAFYSRVFGLKLVRTGNRLPRRSATLAGAGALVAVHEHDG